VKAWVLNGEKRVRERELSGSSLILSSLSHTQQRTQRERERERERMLVRIIQEFGVSFKCVKYTVQTRGHQPSSE
jgi:hypothetical protein